MENLKTTNNLLKTDKYIAQTFLKFRKNIRDVCSFVTSNKLGITMFGSRYFTLKNVTVHAKRIYTPCFYRSFNSMNRSISNAILAVNYYVSCKKNKTWIKTLNTFLQVKFKTNIIFKYLLSLMLEITFFFFKLHY